jgi:C4-dicarboxylate-specific signal transduction histidine kinase
MASLGEMASGMAHEINSPIQTISLIAQRVQRQLNKGLSEQDISESMEKITSNVDKISEIIDSLRKVARNSSEEEFHNTKLKDLIEDVTNITEERFKVNNIQFDVNYHGLSENTLIQCQRLQISQVLINLVNNAYDAIQQMDTKWISVDFKKLPEKILISVCDSGPGIPQEIQDKIFEPLFTTKDIGKGTGLGLSISREIVIKHNGLFYIDQDSTNTCFIIELPIIQMASENT